MMVVKSQIRFLQNMNMINSPENWLDDYGDLLYRYAFSRVRNKEDAEDLVQETLLAGMIAYEKFSGQSKISTWLVGILKHKILDVFRKNKREITILDSRKEKALLNARGAFLLG